jgi:hypothetical protein
LPGVIPVLSHWNSTHAVSESASTGTASPFRSVSTKMHIATKRQIRPGDSGWDTMGRNRPETRGGARERVCRAPNRPEQHPSFWESLGRGRRIHRTELSVNRCTQIRPLAKSN